ncbi:hypothetical protein [Lysobacter auxotrophicus]|uniref:DUF2069 domain-containing protein n=1 Tax=Lysobacter auxotrophicus TaxID=2992573 RepID=A0ABN6UG83_9GAMM|nr:hypothetical protein [Lysobacter auxotrophicus]BDU15311.1 hypothetical protein LA521A_05120 [Lysobacter auxotrophicus]
MESNPYLPPRSPVDAAASDTGVRLSRAYRVANIVYVVLSITLTGLLLATGPVPLDRRSASVFLYFYAPVLCFLVLRWATPAVARWCVGAYGLYLVYLVGVFVWNMSSHNPDVGIGAVIVGINGIALVAALMQLRRRDEAPDGK